MRRNHTHGSAVCPGTKVFQHRADSSTQEPAGQGAAAETLLASLQGTSHTQFALGDVSVSSKTWDCL